MMPSFTKRLMGRLLTSRLRSEGGASLVELAAAMPIFMLLMAYAIDFGYFYLVAATITSSARNGAEYSVMGYEGPAQSSLAVPGPVSTTSSVAALAMADLASLANSSTTATIAVCSKANGMSGNTPKCNSYGPSATGYTPATDPEAPSFVLQRVDITYTIQPPVPLSFFKMSLLPNLIFHRQVSMRAMD